MTDTKTEQATFAAGCFWGVEADFRQIPGVIATTVGYTGGARRAARRTSRCAATRPATPRPCSSSSTRPRSRTRSCSTRSGSLHDPTQLNRQGPDVGDQYRSAIFFHSPEQEAAAKASKEAAQERFSKPIVTEITEAPEFWPAEDYHQRYLEKRGLASCAITVSN